MEHARKQMIEFHTAFNLPMSFNPELPKDEKLRKLRRDILVEEFSEYLLAEGRTI